MLVRDLSNRNSAPSVGHRPVSGIGASSMDRIQPLTKPDESKTSWPTLAVQSSQVLRGTVTRHVARFGAGMGYRVFGLRLRLSSLPALRHLFLRCWIWSAGDSSRPCFPPVITKVFGLMLFVPILDHFEVNVFVDFGSSAARRSRIARRRALFLSRPCFPLRQVCMSVTVFHETGTFSLIPSSGIGLVLRGWGTTALS